MEKKKKTPKHKERNERTGRISKGQMYVEMGRIKTPEHNSLNAPLLRRIKQRSRDCGCASFWDPWGFVLLVRSFYGTDRVSWFIAEPAS